MVLDRIGIGRYSDLSGSDRFWKKAISADILHLLVPAAGQKHLSVPLHWTTSLQNCLPVQVGVVRRVDEVVRQRMIHLSW